MAALKIYLLFGLLSWSSGRPHKRQTDSCQLRLNVDLPIRGEPLFLNKGSNGKLNYILPRMIGDYSAISLASQEGLVLACPGSGNYLTDSSCTASKSADCTGACVSGTLLQFGVLEVNSTQLDCVSRVSPTLLFANKTCAFGRGQLLQIGYQVNSEWLPLIETCHNVQSSFSYYSIHKLYGSTLEGKVTDSYRPSFRRGSSLLYPGFNPNDAYHITNQEAVISDIVGADQVDNYLDTTKQLSLSRGHLAPNGDFLFSAWMSASFFYVNAAPQWQIINNGNWKAVEENSRSLALRLDVDLEVTTGTYGVMTLKNEFGFEEPVYLELDQLPVPDLYWKVLRNPEDSSCISLIASNNPFLKSPPLTLCPDICTLAGWPTLQDDLSKGYVYCCEYNTFSLAVSYSPRLNCTSILRY